MFFQSLIVAAVALAATATPIKEQQPVLDDDFERQQVDLIKESVHPTAPNRRTFSTKNSTF
jgi:hypothetical protein